MPFGFLKNTPGTSGPKQTHQKLLQYLQQNNSARLFMTYGSVKNQPGTQQIFTSVCAWASAQQQQRQLELLVGIWGNNPAKAVQEVGGLLHSAAPYGTIKCNTYGVPYWHVKSLGFTELGGDFNKISAAIFGSTNFTDGALTGANFELDLWAEHTKPYPFHLREKLLDDFTAAIGPLIQDALRTQLPNFHNDVKNYIASLNALYGTNCQII